MSLGGYVSRLSIILELLISFLIRKKPDDESSLIFKSTSLEFIGISAFQQNQLSDVDLDFCTSLSSIGAYAFADNLSLAGFKLPVHAVHAEFGWKDVSGTQVAGGSFVTDLNSYHYVPTPYTLTDEDVEVVDGVVENCNNDFGQKEIIIPNTLDGQVVTEIASELFFKKGLTSVSLPATLEIIGKSAFAANRLTEISLPISIEVVDNSAFMNNELMEVDLSACTSLYYLGDYAFQNNDSIISITLPLNKEYANYGWKDLHFHSFSGGDEVHDFSTCYYIPVSYTLTDNDVVVEGGEIKTCSYSFYSREIIIPESLDGQLITGITDGYESDYGNTGVFRNKGITSIVLPAGLEKIGSISFQGNKLSSLDLRECLKLESIGEFAFTANRLNQVWFASSMRTIKYAAFASNELEKIDLDICELLISIEGGVFAGNPLSSYTLPVNKEHSGLGWMDSEGYFLEGGDSVSIERLVSYYIPATYTLKDRDVVVENGIIKSCSYHFAYRSIIIPDTLDGQIIRGIANEWETETTDPDANHKGVFYGKDLISIELPGTLMTIGTYAFACNELKSIDLSTCTAMTSIGENAFILNGIKGFVLPENATSTQYGWIDENGHRYHSSDTVSDFKSFYYVPAPYTLTDADVEIRNGIIQSCSYSFALWNIILPDKLDGQAVTGIADRGYRAGVFSNKRILRIKLPSTLETIGNYAFCMNQIQEIDLSACKFLISIGEGAFSYNSALDSLDLSACKSLTSIGEAAFRANYSLVSVDLSDCSSLTVIMNEAFQLCRISNLDFSSCTALRSIEDEAFYMNNISHINFDNCSTLKSIESYAFSFNDLESVDLSGCSALTYIGQGAFHTNAFTGFNLPFPDIPGFRFNYWVDGYNKYDAGEFVNMHSWGWDSYSAIFSRVFDVMIIVTDGTFPVQGAEVTLQDYGIVVTDVNGVAVFNNILPESDLTFSVQSPGYEYKTESFSIVNTDMEIRVTLTKITGISTSDQNFFRIYPNPTIDYLIIQTEWTDQYSIEIKSYSGNLIYSDLVENSFHLLDLSSYIDGIYLITISSEDFVITRKIIKL